MAENGPGNTSAVKMSQNKDMLREPWLRHFLESDAEVDQFMLWLRQENLTRPLAFDERIAFAKDLREKHKYWFEKEDYRRALHLILGAIHTLDWKPAEQMGHSEDQRLAVALAMLPAVSNLAMTLLKRGDFENAAKAASVGILRILPKVPEDHPDRVGLRVKLLYRRALAKAEPGPQHDLEQVKQDLTKAATLEPQNREIRTCLENCKKFMREDAEEKQREQAAKKAEKDMPAKGTASADSAKPKSATAGAESANSEEIEEIYTEGTASSSGGNNGNQKGKPELSARTLWWAEQVGRCLGRTKRRCRYARHFLASLPKNLYDSRKAIMLLSIVFGGPLLGAAAAMWRQSSSESAIGLNSTDFNDS